MATTNNEICFTNHGKKVCLPRERIERLLSDGASGEEKLSPWRVFRVMSELVAGFDFLSEYGRSVSFFGTARCAFGDVVYSEAEKLAGLLARDGYTIVTGGGPGVMEAANKGAKEAGGKSVGLNIRLKTEQRANAYVTESESFKYFFTRKVMLSIASQVYVFFPGGFGTLDELFEMLTLVQTEKLDALPIVLVGKEYWAPLLSWITEIVYEKNRAVGEKDLGLYHLVENASEAHALIENSMHVEPVPASPTDKIKEAE